MWEGYRRRAYRPSETATRFEVGDSLSKIVLLIVCSKYRTLRDIQCYSAEMDVPILLLASRISPVVSKRWSAVPKIFFSSSRRFS